jgi:hypothetical protein
MTNKDLEFRNKYLQEFINKLAFDAESGYFYDEKKNFWVIQKPKNVYIYVRRVTESIFPNHTFTDAEIVNWTDLVKKNLKKIRLSNNLVLTNNKIYDISCKSYRDKFDKEITDYMYMYTPLNIKRIKRL